MIKLKEIRKQKQFTQEQIAEILNISRVQAGRIEKGESLANTDQIIKLCNALNCSADYLLGLIDIDESENEKE